MLRRAVQLAASDSVGPLGSESLAGSSPVVKWKAQSGVELRGEHFSVELRGELFSGATLT